MTKPFEKDIGGDIDQLIILTFEKFSKLSSIDEKVRDCVEVALEKEVDTIRTQQGKMRDFLLQVFTSFAGFADRCQMGYFCR